MLSCGLSKSKFKKDLFLREAIRKREREGNKALNTQLYFVKKIYILKKQQQITIKQFSACSSTCMYYVCMTCKAGASSEPWLHTRHEISLLEKQQHNQ